MPEDGFETARSLLDRVEADIAAGDLSALLERCSPDVVLFGSSRANFGPEETGTYLQLVMESNSVRWLLDRWSVLHSDDAHVLLAAEGQVEVDDGTGPARSDFRLTLWLVRDDENWTIGHFHGSVPAA